MDTHHLGGNMGNMDTHHLGNMDTHRMETWTPTIYEPRMMGE